MSSQKTTLAAAITTTGQSSITVTTFVGFPATGAYTILIDSEQLRVTAGNGTTTWTVSRGHGGTTAATHSNGATVTHVPEAYAELADLAATMALDGTARYEMLGELMGDVSRDIDAACLRSFAVPTADVTFYLDVARSGQPSLRAASGGWSVEGYALDLVSVTTLSVRDSETDASYSEVAAGDTGYYLQMAPGGVGVAGTAWPYGDVVLSPACSRTSFPTGYRAVKLVAKPGFPAVPSPVRRATISETRERYRQSIGGGPSPIGTNQFGQPIFLTGDSPDMRRIMRPPYSLQGWVG